MYIVGIFAYSIEFWISPHENCLRDFLTSNIKVTLILCLHGHMLYLNLKVTYIISVDAAFLLHLVQNFRLAYLINSQRACVR